jgi:tRNA nucleotidyltransferase (CCA-adding enzyme)
MYPENHLVDALRQVMGDNKIYLVGGSVRDFLLDRPVKDYDFLVEGDWRKTVRELAGVLGIEPEVNEKLLSASFPTADGVLDLTCARGESYAYPGALPQVWPADFTQDLARRDFTVNTLAVRLLPEGWGELTDMLGGVADLRRKQLRILHPRSFADDPTRILRAIRLKNRLGFRVEKNTLRCLRENWAKLQNVSPARRYKEWLLLGGDDLLPQDLFLIRQYGGWSYCFAGLPFCRERIGNFAALLAQVKPVPLRSWLLVFLPLCADVPGKFPDIASFWGLAKKDCREIRQALAVLQEWPPNRTGAQLQRRYYRSLKNLGPDVIYYLFGEYGAGLSWESFYQGFRAARMPVSGKDLLALGLEAGPVMGMLLKELEERYWREEYSSRDEGLRLAKSLFKEILDGHNQGDTI